MKLNIKILPMLLLAAALASPCAEAAPAPLNPAYVEYMSGAKTTEADATVTRGSRSLSANEPERAASTSGYLPSPVGWSHLDGKTWSVVPAEDGGATALAAARRSARSTSSLPAKYDLRDKMPAVRDQTGFNNCWTYSAMAATESNLITKGLASTDIDLSEWYVTYFRFNSWDGGPTFRNVWGGEYHQVGGNDWDAVAMLARGIGSVTTAKAPDIAAPYNRETIDYDYSAVYAPAPAARDFKLVSAKYLGSAGALEVPLNAEGRREMIKRAIMEHGAVSVGIHLDEDKTTYNYETDAYYSGYTYNQELEGGNTAQTNHAVAIVGWDDEYSVDNFIQKPGSNGAWIIRNSYGSGDWGDGGYFYVSYEEGTLCDGVVYDSEKAHGGEKIYQHDELGLNTFYNIYDRLSRADGAKNIHYFANTFTAESSDMITSAAFYVVDTGIDYEVSLYVGCSADSPVSGTLAARKSASSLVPGYATVEFDEPAEVAAGTRFSVVVKATASDSSYAYTIPAQYRLSDKYMNADAEPGNGWVSVDGETFYDAYHYGLEEPTPVVNLIICLKAFGERIYTVSEAPVVVTGEIAADGTVSAASASNVSTAYNAEVQQDVVEALRNEAVAGVAADKNVALLGAFTLDVTHGGGSAAFDVELDEPLSFEGSPYVIIQSHAGEYAAFEAEYAAMTLSFTVDRLEDYFSSAAIVVADVKDRAALPAHSSGGGSGGGCSAGFGALALLALAPMMMRRKK